MEPSVPPLKLSNSQLVVVIAQVRFSPILNMARFIPDVQERLRGEGFPKFHPLQQQNLQIGGPGMPVANQGSTLLWEFLDRDDRKSLVVSTDTVAFVVTDYSVFESFRDGLRIALSVVSEVAKPGLPEPLRCGYGTFGVPV